MMFLEDGGVRLTDGELRTLRTRAAMNGRAIQSVATRQQLHQAISDGLSIESVEELLALLDGGSAEQK